MVATASGPVATVSKLQHHRWRDRFGRGPDAPTCHHLDEGPSDEPRGYPRVLPKTAVASHRFVFVMGVESSGHHLLQRVFGNCAAQSGNTRCRDAAALRKLLSSDKGRRGLFGARFEQAANKSSRPWSASRGEFPGLVRSIGRSIALLRTGSGGLISVNTIMGWGMLSYPNYGGACKRHQVPNVRILAEIFESHGADLRILVLVRNAFDVVASAVGRSHFFSGEATSALKMFTEIIREEMVPQLERIDSAFYRHLDYDRLPSAVPHDLGEWLGFGQSGNPPRGFREEPSADQVARVFRRTNRSGHRQEQLVRRHVEDYTRANAQLLGLCVAEKRGALLASGAPGIRQVQVRAWHRPVT